MAYTLYIIYNGSNKLSRVPGLERILHDQFLNKLCEDAQGSIWCSGQNDVTYCVSIKHGKATKVSRWNNAPGSLRGYFVDKFGRLLRITGKGIAAFNPHTCQFMDAGYQLPADMVSAGLSCISRATDGGLWIGTELGVYKIAKGRRTAERIECADASFDLSKMSIHTVFSDHNGNLWAACFHNGLFLLSNRRLPFHSWTLSTQIPACPGDISSIAPAVDSGVWACTWGNGIYHFNAGGIVTQHLTFSSTVQRIAPRNGGGYWVCTNDGVYQMDDHGSSRMVLPYQGFKTAICEGDNGSLFVALSGIGLVKFNLRTKQISQYSSKSRGRNGHLCNDWVSALVVDQNRYLWISTTSGLCCMDLCTGSFHPFGRASLLNGICINKMSILPNQDVAIATESGLYLYQRKTRRLSLFPNSSALEDQQIYNLQTDERGDMWICWRRSL